jgi:hypothetical protein
MPVMLSGSSKYTVAKCQPRFVSSVTVGYLWNVSINTLKWLTATLISARTVTKLMFRQTEKNGLITIEHMIAIVEIDKQPDTENDINARTQSSMAHKQCSETPSVMGRSQNQNDANNVAKMANYMDTTTITQNLLRFVGFALLAITNGMQYMAQR